jgi:hypothetical protein
VRRRRLLPVHARRREGTQAQRRRRASILISRYCVQCLVSSMC